VILVNSYKPIIALHGFALTPNQGTFHDWDNIAKWIAQEHPGQIFIPLNIFNGLDSTRPLWEQVPQIANLIQSTVSNQSFAQGYHFLGHSQGGLLMRVMLEVIDNHQVDTFVSLAGVQFGIYGIGFINHYFQNITDEYATEFLYTSVMQDEFSAANFWHSPFPQNGYLTNNIFLPVVNNQVPNKDYARYKANFLKAKQYVFFGSPQDGTVVPWESSIWGFYDDNENIVSFQNQDIYVQDTFGLKTANGQGKISLRVVNGIPHGEWLKNQSNFVSNVLPYLN
jgi:palmitoyl-protein thioesterase